MPGLDINWFRQDKGYDPNIIRNSLKKRFRDPKLVDEVIQMDKQWRKMRNNLDKLKKVWNEIVRAMKDKKIADKNDPCQQQIKKKNENQIHQKDIQLEEKILLKKIHAKINSIGNIVHQSVPVSDNEDQNRVIRVWRQPTKIKMTGKRGGLHHNEILQAIGGYDPERGRKIAGHRGYFLKGPGVLLNQALINYGLKFLNKNGYQLTQPPYFLKKQIMAQTCQLEDFDEQLYKITTGNNQEDENYLIATSQQPISAMHRGQWMEEANLPLKYGGISTCFRKEAGAYGKETWGIFRVHQFEKLEQFLITKPQQSWEAFEKMVKTSQQFYQSLGLPFRVVEIVSGALNDAASKKCDLQAWFPGYQTYRQLVSCSNCLDFQARNLNIRCGIKKKDQTEKRYVHLLNGTLCATERTLCCILENYQTEDGVKIPQVLQSFMQTDFIPYIEQKKKEKKLIINDIMM